MARPVGVHSAARTRGQEGELSNSWAMPGATPVREDDAVPWGPTTSAAGFMIVELMVFLGAAVLLLSGALLSAHAHSQQRRVHSERTLALTACRNTFERLRSLDVATIAALAGTGFDVPGMDGQPNGLTPTEGDADGLPGTIRVETYRTAASGTVYLVTTAVRWVGATRGGRFDMQCLIGSRR